MHICIYIYMHIVHIYIVDSGFYLLMMGKLWEYTSLNYGYWKCWVFVDYGGPVKFYTTSRIFIIKWYRMLSSNHEYIPFVQHVHGFWSWGSYENRRQWSMDWHVWNHRHHYQPLLVGGLEHLLFRILGTMIPTDFHIFQRG